MTYLKNILLPFLLLLPFAGCTQDEAETIIPGEIRLILNIPTLNMVGALPSKSISADSGESTITNVYLLFYQQDAADTDAPLFFYAETGLNAEGSWNKMFKTTEMPQLEPNIKYDVYALASLPSGVSAPTAATTKAALLSLQENLTDQTTDWVISFSGTSTYTFGTLGELKIDLKRTVARLDIFIDNRMSAQDISFTLEKEPSFGFYLKDKTDSPLTKTKRKSTMIKENEKYRFYLYEHTAGSDPVRIYLRGMTPAGKPIFQIIQFQHDGSTDIKRNNIYNINLTLQEPVSP